MITEPEIFDLDDNPTCSSTCTKYLHIPDVAFIHINRTFYSKKGVQKINAHVNFPLSNFDIVSALSNESSKTSSSSSSSGGSGSNKSSGSNNSEPLSSYKLYGIVVHHGRAMNQGHFTAYALVGDDWYHFNDHRVTKVKNINVIKSQHATLLVYQRK
jgi:ubiquitin C-terminal hydrolase